MDPRKYRLAKKKVREKKEFYSHFTSFITVNLFLFILNLLTSPGAWWFYWPLLGWGIGLVSHYVKVFGLPGGTRVLTDEWEEQEFERELRKMGDQPEQNAQLEEPEEEELDLNKSSQKEKEIKYNDKDFV